jgi:hypothetical protein
VVERADGAEEDTPGVVSIAPEPAPRFVFVAITTAKRHAATRVPDSKWRTGIWKVPLFPWRTQNTHLPGRYFPEFFIGSILAELKLRS